MTALHPGLRERSGVQVLHDGALREFEVLLDSDPFVHAVLAARVRAAPTLGLRRLGGLVLGVRRRGELVGACYAGAGLLPVGGDAPAWVALAGFLARRPGGCTSIVGRADAVAVMWPLLARSWAPARSVRARQPLLLLDGPVPVEPDDSVRAARPSELERYLPAAAAMYTEELGVSPHVAPGSAQFRARVSEFVGTGRAFAGFDRRGQVTFKAEIAAISLRTCQIQGVWVRPDLRGRGIGTASLATVMAHALTLAPTVSLYVNDYNAAARRLYARLGMRQVATLSTVLL